MKIFPRKEEIPPSYTGCQSLWFETAVSSGEFEKIWVLYLESGSVKIEQVLGSMGNFLCTYKEGKLIGGKSSECDENPSPLFESSPKPSSKPPPPPPPTVRKDSCANGQR